MRSAWHCWWSSTLCRQPNGWPSCCTTCLRCRSKRLRRSCTARKRNPPARKPRAEARARQGGRVGHRLASQRQVVDAFLAALRAGDVEGLLAVLDPDLVVRVDSTSRAAGGAPEVHGAETWARGAVAFSRGARFAQPALVNGAVGLVLAPRGRLFRALTFTMVEGKIASIDVIGDRRASEGSSWRRCERVRFGRGTAAAFRQRILWNPASAGRLWLSKNLWIASRSLPPEGGSHASNFRAEPRAPTLPLYCTFAVTLAADEIVNVHVLRLSPPLEHAPDQMASRPLVTLSVMLVPGANEALPLLPVGHYPRRRRRDALAAATGGADGQRHGGWRLRGWVHRYPRSTGNAVVAPRDRYRRAKPTAAVVTANVAVRAPAATVTCRGRRDTGITARERDGRLRLRSAARQRDRALCVRPPTRLDGEIATLCSVAAGGGDTVPGVTVTLAVRVVPLYVAVMVTVVVAERVTSRTRMWR